MQGFFSGGTAFKGVAGGQLTGNYPNPTLSIHNGLIYAALGTGFGDDLPYYNTLNAANQKCTTGQLGGLIASSICNGRLTLTSGTPAADATAQTNLYFTPYNGPNIALYDGTQWNEIYFTEFHTTNSGLTASLPYDVFVYLSSGNPTLDLTAWTNTTTRATALTTQDGILVKSGALTHRYVGTITTDANSKFNDGTAARNVWNYYNRVSRSLTITDSTQHTYATAAWRNWDNSGGTYSCGFTCGVIEDAISFSIGADTTSTSGASHVGIATSSGGAAFVHTYDNLTSRQFYSSTANNLPSLGYNPLYIVEFESAGTATYYTYVMAAIIRG